MLKLILAVVAGFVTWTILWVGSDAAFGAVSPSWAKTSADFQTAFENGTPYNLETWTLIVHLLKSFVVSMISGLTAAWIARESFKSTLILGVLLLAFGIFVQASLWNYMPLWYHISFLVMLIPMTMLGGRIFVKN